jgi:hypothetical protein
MRYLMSNINIMVSGGNSIVINASNHDTLLMLHKVHLL